MAARPSWRGQLRLALVSCPIRLVPATTAKDQVRFHKLNRTTGNRLRQQMIDSETEDVVPREGTIMGYEFEKGRYVTVKQDELDRLKIESSETIIIERVVPASAVDCLYWDTPYLAEPDGKTGLDIFATIREALKDKQVVGIGRAVLARRERPVLVMPRGKGMLIITLRDPDEVRKPESEFEEIQDVEVDKQNLSMAEMLIERMEGPFDLTMFQDRYQAALHDLVEAKMKGQTPIVSEQPERPTNVVNLFDALKASLETKGVQETPEPRAKSKRNGSASGTRTAKTRSRKRA